MKKLPILVGVIHLPALPGAPGSSELMAAKALQNARDWAVEEAKLLTKAGFDGIIIENFGDVPFYKTEVPPETIASMAIIAAAVRASAPKVKLGINVLRNDARSALAIAAVTGADFIRVNVLSGVAATDQGMVEGNAADLVRERVRLNAKEVLILADVHVKHAQTLSSKNLALAIEEVSGRGGADGVIISGYTTGRSPDAAKLLEAQDAVRELNIPLYIGSGASVEALPGLAKDKVRIIVGSAIRRGGKAGAPIDEKRLKQFSEAWKKENR
jgi:membrane complex biogenesis BtpA family protein